MKVLKLPEDIGSSFWCRPHTHKTLCRSDQTPQRICHCTARCSSDIRCNAPIVQALLSEEQRGVAPFHIPGHKRGAGVLEDFQRIISKGTLQYDLTELPGLDNLADPSGPIAESQELAASVFGADKTWYLVNGTSVGLQAAVMATCRPGDALIIARNCHVSAFAAMALADAWPVWVAPDHDRESDVAQGVSPAVLEDAFARAHDSGLNPRAALVVSPTYFGACSDIPGLADICHQHRVPLIVDAAHGSHLGLQPGFPASALQSGADVVVQSTHKTLSSLGQSSMLHCKGHMVPHLRISDALRLLQTTSPSYLLLASLDAAQAQARKLALEGLPLPLEAVAAAKAELKALPGIVLLEDSSSGCSVAAYDPWRITVNVRQLGRTGFEAETELHDQHSVYAEMATHKVAVFALGTGTTQQHLDSLVAGITALCKTNAMEVKDAALQLPLQLPEAAQMSPRAAFFADKEMVDFRDAAGRISGNIICPYPPGVPVVFPGEQLTKETLNFARSVLVAGGSVTGAADRTLQRLLVVKAEA